MKKDEAVRAKIMSLLVGETFVELALLISSYFFIVKGGLGLCLINLVSIGFLKTF